jgi:hypothetical protein
VHLYLCRWRSETLASVLKPGSVVVIGGRKRLVANVRKESGSTTGVLWVSSHFRGTA